MKTDSETINRAIEFALQHGNSISETQRGWSEMQEVVYMHRKLSDELRNELKKIVPYSTPPTKGALTMKLVRNS